MKFETCKCGCNEFYMLQRISGYCEFHVDNNGIPADNSDMYDGLEYSDVWKYYRCVDCGRRAKEVANEQATT